MADGTSEETQEGGDGMGASLTPGLAQPHNDEVDDSQPMGLRRQIQEIVDNQSLSTEQIQILVRELLKARTGQPEKRTRDEADDDSDRPRKRRADHDIKYNTIKELKLGTTLKSWSNWKMEIQRAFDAAPYKYDNDRAKVIKALIHLHEDCKTMWNNHICTAPDDEYDWEAFIAWLDTTVRDQGNNDLATRLEWEKARQRPDQAPWAFDAYLTSLERGMESKSEWARAMDFFIKLRPNLSKAIRLSGIDPLPQTRQAMLSLATRMWEEIRHEEKDSGRKETKKPWESNKPTPSNQNNNSSAPSPRNGQSRHRTTPQQDSGKDKAEGKAESKTGKQKGPKEYASGVNDKGERICYICGSTEHLVRYHKKDDKGDSEQKDKPRVHVLTTGGRKKGHERMAEKAWEQTDSSSENE